MHPLPRGPFIVENGTWLRIVAESPSTLMVCRPISMALVNYSATRCRLYSFENSSALAAREFSVGRWWR